MTAAILMLLTAPLQLQTAYADLISTSPKNIVTVSGVAFVDSSFEHHGGHSKHCHLILIPGICVDEKTHHVGHCHWTRIFIGITSSHLFNNYNLEVKSLKDYNIHVAIDNRLSGVVLTIKDADGVTTTTLDRGDNPITPVSKGTSTISFTNTGLENHIGSHEQVLIPSLEHSHGAYDCDAHVHTGTPTSDFTYTITQANAGGPKPRLSQVSGENLLGFSTITQLFDIPAKTDSLTVTAAGATSCEVFDQHGASRGICGAAIGLGSGDYSGLWKVEASAVSGTTKMSAKVDGNPLELLTEVTK